jgi:hypothetical protein
MTPRNQSTIAKAKMSKLFALERMFLEEVDQCSRDADEVEIKRVNSKETTRG